MKLDIEGFELKVLSAFFASVPRGSALRPKTLLVEFIEGFDRGPNELARAIEAAGYRLIAKRSGASHNALFERT
jgi:hypothetical protein